MESASNLRQIGLAIDDYAGNHGGELPDSFQSLFPDGNVSSDIFISPRTLDMPATGPITRAVVDQLTAGGHLSYVYLGRGLTTKTVTPDTIIAYEILDQPNDGTNILFGDGHVEWFDPSVAAMVDAKRASGMFPITVP